MRLVAVAALGVALTAWAPAATARDRPEPVTRWLEIELAEIASHRMNPPRAARALALLSVAMRDATREGRGRPDATIAGAAATVLVYVFPDRAAAFEELAAEERPTGAVERGRAIGARVVERARADGSGAVWQGAAPAGRGLWVPTPPALAAPLEPLAGTWRTWNLASGSQLRPGPPTAFGSARYAAEIREVYDVSRSLTDEQKRIADLWADGAGTVTPPGHWSRIALDLIRARGLSSRSAARVLAVLNTAQADAFIACWDAKFAYWSERPLTAIRRELDPTWAPYIATPPFPSYVSGHSTTSGAASEVLAAYFPPAATQLRAWALEAAVSRLYGGIHFRSDNEAGLALGKRIAAVALARSKPRFQPA
jgi:membrane-associated phospholipid phosphatase